MSAAERALFVETLGHARGYLEFGAGGSTLLAHSIVPGAIYTVDSSRDWLCTVASHISGRARMKLLHADIGPTGAWGFPLSIESHARFPNYHSGVWPEVDADAIDVVLIDGRFRVACLAAAVRHLRRDTLLMIHDYRSRPCYRAVEEIADIVAEQEDLTVFRAKATAASQADSVLGSYAFDPR